MKTLLLTFVLSLSLISGASATTTSVPFCEANACAGGLSGLSAASQIVGAATIGLVAVYAIQQNKFDCTITKTAPLPGTNYTNEKSVCVEK